MKRILALFLAAVLALSLAACGGGGAPSPTDPPDGQQQPAQQTGDGAQLSGTVEYWSSWSETEPQADVIARAAEAFMEQNPEVKINITWNGRDLRKLIIPALEAGTQIDCFDHNADTVTALWSDYILDLTDFYQQAYPTTGGKTFEEYTMPAFVALAEKLGGGSKYVLPYAPQALLWNYNKDIFAAAGVSAAPATWEEFLAACEKIKAAGYTPITTDDAYAVNVYGYYLAKLKGDDWVFELVNDATKAMWDDPACLEAAKAIQELADKGYYAANVASNKFPSAQQEMVIEEKTAMYLNGTWLPNEVKDTAREDFPWGQFAFPTVPGGVDGPEAGAYGCTGLAINKNADPKVAEAAFSFFVFLTSGEWDKTYAEETRSIPMDQANAWPAALADAEKIIPAYTTRYYSQTAIRMNNDVLPVIQSGVINLISGNMTAEQFIAEMKK